MSFEDSINKMKEHTLRLIAHERVQARWHKFWALLYLGLALVWFCLQRAEGLFLLGLSVLAYQDWQADKARIAWLEGEGIK